MKHLAVILLLFATAAPLWARRPICSPPPPRNPQPADPSAFAQVRSDLLSGNRSRALSEAEAILGQSPGNPEASFMIGTLLLDQGQPAQAIVCFRNAQAVWADRPDVHAGLVEAYAETGDRRDRDRERAILRGYHADGRHPSAARSPGILIERFQVAGKFIESIEYFSPQGPNHVSYRFIAYDAKGATLGDYAFAADDQDQADYLRQHPDAAGSSLRRYALQSDFSGQVATLGTIDGAPSYDDFRTRIVSVLQASAPRPLPPARASK